jgi:hypothetical protein
MLGHKSEDSTWPTAKALGITIMTGSMPVCKACAHSKAKQKNVPKKLTSEPVTWPFQRVHMDISQIKVLDEDQNEVTESKTSYGSFVLMPLLARNSQPSLQLRKLSERTLWNG